MRFSRSNAQTGYKGDLLLVSYTASCAASNPTFDTPGRNSTSSCTQSTAFEPSPVDILSPSTIGTILNQLFHEPALRLSQAAHSLA